MSAAASSGTNQQLTLDVFSFEKLLAAAWVLQCQQDQQRNRRDSHEAMVEPVKTQAAKIQPDTETSDPTAQAPVESVIQPSLWAAATESQDPPLSHALESREIGPNPGELKSIGLEPIKLTTIEPNRASQPRKSGLKHLARPLFYVWSKLEGNAAKLELAKRSRILVKLLKDGKPEWRRFSADLRKSFNQSRRALRHGVVTLRVNFPQRSLRAVAIATPVWLLAIIGAFLLLKTSLHGSFPGAQANSTPAPSVAEAAVAGNAGTVSRTTPGASEPARWRETAEPRRSRSVLPFAGSHQQITDPATASVVQQLSRYEISGLRRRAKYGDDSAAFTLGMAYEVGRHVRQNCAEAARWVKTAAEEGDAAAQYNLGLRYRDGDGVPADHAESQKWLRRAASHRYRQAKLALQLLASR